MNTSTWKEVLFAGVVNPWIKITEFIPNILGMLIILLVGYLVSKGLQKLTIVILKKLGFDRLGTEAGLDRLEEHAGIRLTSSDLLGLIVFWFFMLTFLISAAETLGLGNVSRTIGVFVRYLPNLFGATLILLAGLTLGRFIRTVVQNSVARLGLDYSRGLGSLSYGAIAIVTLSLAVGQLQIETVLFNRVVEILLIAAGIALALALGLGTRDIAKHIVAGVYVRDVYKPGTTVEIGSVRGTIRDVGTVITRIQDREAHTVYVPNATLTDTMVREVDADS